MFIRIKKIMTLTAILKNSIVAKGAFMDILRFIKFRVILNNGLI